MWWAAAAYIGFQGDVEDSKETGPEKPHGQELDEEREFGEVRDVMCAKDPCNRPSHKNNTCQTESPTAVAPAKAQVPTREHQAGHEQRKRQNDQENQTCLFADRWLIRPHAFEIASLPAQFSSQWRPCNLAGIAGTRSRRAITTSEVIQPPS